MYTRDQVAPLDSILHTVVQNNTVQIMTVQIMTVQIMTANVVPPLWTSSKRVCPRCGRPGLAHQSRHHQRFIHWPSTKTECDFLNGWIKKKKRSHIKGFRPEWYIFTMIYSQDLPFWLETLDTQKSHPKW